MLLKGVVFSFLVAFQVQAQAQVQKIMIGNQSVEVTDLVERTSKEGRQILHSAHLVAPTELGFARGNHLQFSGTLVFHDNGSVWMAEAEEGAPVVNWKTPYGQTVILHCGQPPVVNGIQPPVKYIVFYQNGEYQSGCRSLRSEKFTTKLGGMIGVESLSGIDLDHSGFLKYAKRISSGELEMSGRKVQLDPGSEVDFHDNGKPHFFRLAAGESFPVSVERLGEVLVQRGDPAGYTQFNEKGQLEAAVIGRALKVGNVSAPSGSYISFETLQTSGGGRRELSVVLPEEQQLAVGGRSLWVSQVHFDGKDRVIGVSITRGFHFHSPEGDDLDVPARSKVYFLPTGEIVRIDVSL